MKHTLKSVRKRVDFTFHKDEMGTNVVQALLRLQSFDEYIDIYENLIAFDDDLKHKKAKNSTFVNGEDMPMEPTREEFCDRMIKSGDVLDDVIDFVDDYRNKLEDEGFFDLASNVKSCVRKRRFTDDGGEVSIERVLGGDPEYWETCQRDGKKEFVTIGIQASMSWANGTESFAKNVALAYCVCDVLENLGYGVSIDCLMTTHHKLTEPESLKRYYPHMKDVFSKYDMWDSECGHIFPLKDTAEQVDLRNIASASFPSLKRKYGFAFDRLLWDYDNGSCMETSNEMLKLSGIDIMIANQWNDDDTQVQNVVKTIKEMIDNRLG